MTISLNGQFVRGWTGDLFSLARQGAKTGSEACKGVDLQACHSDHSSICGAFTVQSISFFGIFTNSQRALTVN